MFPFKTALNASTLFPYELGIREQIQVAAEAGYEGIEIWMKDLQAFAAEGGSIAELRRETEALGIRVVNAISFIAWADTDPAVREGAMRQTDEELALLAELGCPAFAAPPFGDAEGSTPEELAERFAVLERRASGTGVEPILEFWGRAKVLSNLTEARRVAELSGIEGVRILLDPFHMYTGGGSLAELEGVSGDRIGIVHANDYPAVPGRDAIQDSERVFPGEGIAPSAELARRLAASGYEGYLSLELFIPDFGGKTALETAAYGLEKLRKTYSV